MNVCCCVDGNIDYISGIFDAHVMDNGVSRLIATYDNIGSFGELALMYNTPRATTIIARTVGALWCLVRETFISFHFFCIIIRKGWGACMYTEQ